MSWYSHKLAKGEKHKSGSPFCLSLATFFNVIFKKNDFNCNSLYPVSLTLSPISWKRGEKLCHTINLHTKTHVAGFMITPTAASDQSKQQPFKTPPDVAHHPEQRDGYESLNHRCGKKRTHNYDNDCRVSIWVCVMWKMLSSSWKCGSLVMEVFLVLLSSLMLNWPLTLGSKYQGSIHSFNRMHEDIKVVEGDWGSQLLQFLQCISM